MPQMYKGRRIRTRLALMRLVYQVLNSKKSEKKKDKELKVIWDELQVVEANLRRSFARCKEHK